MNNFKEVDIDNGCKDCQYDIFTLLEKEQDNDKKNSLLTDFLISHNNYELLSLFHNKNLNIKNIPREIEVVLFDLV